MPRNKKPCVKALIDRSCRVCCAVLVAAASQECKPTEGPTLMASPKILVQLARIVRHVPRRANTKRPRSCEAHTGSECPPNVRRQPEVGWQRGATIAKRDGPGTGRVERGLSPRQSCLESSQGAIHDKDNLSDVLGEHKYTEN